MMFFSEHALVPPGHGITIKQTIFKSISGYNACFQFNVVKNALYRVDCYCYALIVKEFDFPSKGYCIAGNFQKVFFFRLLKKAFLFKNEFSHPG